ncbi:hypothetical protein ACFQAV_02360 [Companilactobacillus huachuanensis]|uniref:Uncharacterized protein n=1 Tax=Companilactobacillus huachuanensis TaxID=2559914 RepID=A0ABW1RHT6_9LACO|nr:hypothetical protein [Companilactobacillus huachuanensis]
MYTYIQIIDKDSKVFKGYVFYNIENEQLSMTIVRGMKALHRINIPFSKIVDLQINKFYGEDRISFIYQGKKYSFLYTGYGEEQYLEQHLLKTMKA